MVVEVLVLRDDRVRLAEPLVRHGLVGQVLLANPVPPFIALVIDQVVERVAGGFVEALAAQLGHRTQGAGDPAIGVK